MDRQFLNNDVVTEILLHLPVQSLFRFRSVSKFWCHIIDSSAFRKLHVQNQLNHNNNNDSDDNTAIFLQFIEGEKRLWEMSIMLLDNGKSYKDFPSFHEFFNDNIKSRSIRVVGPVNGLICIHNKDSYTIDQASWSRLATAVCNPSLGKIKILPISPQRKSPWNPNKDTVFTRATGFGFDYVTKEYKVVQLSSSYKLPWFSQLRIYVEVYTGAAGTWRELATDTVDQNLFITKWIKSSSSYKNGSFAHWRGHSRVRPGPFKDIILSFDMHNEVFETIMIPDYENKGEEIKSKLFARNDSFLLFVYPRNSNFTRGDKWLKIYELKSTEGNKRRWIHVSDIGPFLVVPRPMALWKSDGVVLRYFCKKNKLIFYDICTQTVRYFEMPDNECRFRILEYRGSLISP